ncbi:MAG: hypothetical protein AAGL24_09890 [Pseudomonadota bacterium]
MSKEQEEFYLLACETFCRNAGISFTDMHGTLILRELEPSARLASYSTGTLNGMLTVLFSHAPPESWDSIFRSVEKTLYGVRAIAEDRAREVQSGAGL